jgi:phage shock protein A
MALINRFVRLFQADLHGLLDRIEEPETLLKQALREMAEELVGAEQRLKRLQQEQEQLTRRGGELKRSLAQMSEELDLCFESGGEPLARALVKRKLEAQKLLDAIDSRRDEQAQRIGEQQAQLSEMSTQYESMQQKAEILAGDSHDSAGRDESAWPTAELRVADQEIEMALLREKQSRGLL